MADSLVLTGVKDVKKHTGTEMLLTLPKRGGSTHSLKEWWKTGANKCYVMCTVFNVTTATGTVKLVLDTSAGTNVRIDHDGSFNFIFYGMNEVSRAALFTDAYELIEHYVFPRISGGKVMTVTPPGGASRPSVTPPKTFTGVTLTGPSVSTDAGTETYSASKTGTATDVTYVITSADGADVVSGLDVTFNGAGDRVLTLTGSSAEVGTSQTDTLTVTVS